MRLCRVFRISPIISSRRQHLSCELTAFWLSYDKQRQLWINGVGVNGTLYDFYHYFYMVTNVLFYVSSAVNPVLYNLVSANYRQIFFSTLSYFCLPCRRKKQTRMLTRHSISICSNQTFSTNVVKETVY
ncbi:hypothetical protein MHYP_G00075120 [Metynnis hypsauchen]